MEEDDVVDPVSVLDESDVCEPVLVPVSVEVLPDVSPVPVEDVGVV